MENSMNMETIISKDGTEIAALFFAGSSAPAAALCITGKNPECVFFCIRRNFFLLEQFIIQIMNCCYE